MPWNLGSQDGWGIVHSTDAESILLEYAPKVAFPICHAKLVVQLLGVCDWI